MNERQKNLMYGAIGALVLMALLSPFDNLRWDEVKRSVALLFIAVVVGGGLWYLAKKRKP